VASDLVQLYIQDLPEGKTNMYYIKSFIGRFRGLPEEWIKGTLWYDLWLIRDECTEEQLETKILNMATLLTEENSLYGKQIKVEDRGNCE
jgi:hypothetical protein